LLHIYAASAGTEGSAPSICITSMHPCIHPFVCKTWSWNLVIYLSLYLATWCYNCLSSVTWTWTCLIQWGNFTYVHTATMAVYMTWRCTCDMYMYEYLIYLLFWCSCGLYLVCHAGTLVMRYTLMLRLMMF
jgi:hypothetical protein